MMVENKLVCDVISGAVCIKLLFNIINIKYYYPLVGKTLDGNYSQQSFHKITGFYLAQNLG